MLDDKKKLTSHQDQAHAADQGSYSVYLQEKPLNRNKLAKLMSIYTNIFIMLELRTWHNLSQNDSSHNFCLNWTLRKY